ncbi:MAG: DUF445 domain-containing protein [Candidatus Baltobacteraceae bacterium]|jgi:uncharacterized membrane-anchored protein YjiN (DUF445 family)
MALTALWADTERKRGKLLRVKLIATSLLPVMAVLFIAAAHYQTQVPSLAWLEAFAEAALVGGLADWFAIVALFRHPAGLPLPHTAIIPKNKDRIGAQLGEFVEQNFLTPENITAKLRDADLAARVVAWFAEPENARRLIAAGRIEMPRIVRAVDDPEIERAIARVISGEIERLDLTRVAARMLAMLTRDGRHQRFLDEMLPVVSAWLNEHRPQIKLLFGRRPALVPQWLHAYVVDRFVDGVVDKIAEIVKTPDHPLRAAFDTYVRRFITQLETDPEIARDVDDMRAEILRSRAVGTAVEAVWRAVKARIVESSEAREFESDAWMARLVARVAREILADRALLDRLNANVLAAIESALMRSQNQFAALIEGIVRKWDTELVTDKVELELGPDLQFIRLNGTFIGGLAGVALHALLLLAGHG